MTEQKRIKVVIDPIGNPKIEAEGFHGQGCTDATAPIENALSGGKGGVAREYKPEWNMTEGSQNEYDYARLTG